MRKHSRLRAPLLSALAAGGLAVGVAACGDRNADDAALAQDSSLSRDLALAGQADSAQPQLQDVPADSAAAVTPPVAPPPAAAPSRTSASGGTTVRPTRPRPAPSRPTTPAAAPREPERTASGNTVTTNPGGAAESVGAIPAGTTISLASNSKVCTNTNRVGDRFTARVVESVSGSNAATSPAGATATVEVTKLDRSENVRDKIEMGFRVVSVTFGGRTYAVDATTQSADVARVRNQPASKDRQKVIGGAVIG